MELEFNFNLDPESLLLKEKQTNKSLREAVDDEIRALYRRMDELKNLIQDKQVNLSKLRMANTELDRQIAEERNRKRLEELERQKRKNEDDIERFMKEVTDKVREICEPLEKFSDARAYQIEDIVSTVAAYLKNRGGMLNANDMGMGKTFEAAFVIYILKTLMPGAKFLWLTKKSLVEQGSTRKELQHWIPELKILSPKSNATASEREFIVSVFDQTKADVFLVNYEYIRTTKAAREFAWDVLIVDEAHKLKGGANANGPTAIFNAAVELTKKVKFKLFLTGTPMVNAPEEMWSYLHVFKPDLFPTLKQFTKDFMSYRDVAGEYKLAVDPNKIMANALKGMMIRRSAVEVGLQIPELTVVRRDLDMLPQQREVYDQMATQFFIWLDGMQDKPLTAMAILAQLTRLRQISNWPVFKYTADEVSPTGDLISTQGELNVPYSSKLDEAVDIIEEAQDQVLVVCTFNEPLYELQRRCRENDLRCEIINGTIKHDYDVEAHFQSGKIDVLCLNSAMGEGLNLQKNPERWDGGARYGIELDRWWSPARNEQAMKRIHRQGSMEHVFWYSLHSNKSVDQAIEDLCNEKSESFSSIMNANELRPASGWSSYLRNLMGKD